MEDGARGDSDQGRSPFQVNSSPFLLPQSHDPHLEDEGSASYLTSSAHRGLI